MNFALGFVWCRKPLLGWLTPAVERKWPFGLADASEKGVEW